MLHNLSGNKESDLEFFSMFSSGAALMGNLGQPNHSSACAHLDAHSAYRAGLGLAGSSINWGAVGEVGYAARHSVGQSGVGTVPIEHTIGILECSTKCSGSNLAALPAFGMPGWGNGLSQRFKDNMGARQAAA